MEKTLVKLIENSLKLVTMNDLVNWLDVVDVYEKKHTDRCLAKAVQELRNNINYKFRSRYSSAFWNIMDTLYALTGLKKGRMVQLMTEDDKSSLEYRVAVCWVTQTAMLNIPMDVIVGAWSPADCPRCGAQLSTHHGDGYYTHPYYLDRCPDCGQMLKWHAN